MVLSRMGDAASALVLGLLVVASLFLRSRSQPRITRNGQPLRKPANTLPLVGNGILFLQARQKLLAWFARCARDYGVETLRIGVPSLPPGVIVACPANLDFVFRHEGSAFAKGGFFRGRSLDLFGGGIINADGEAWRLQRRAGQRFLGANLAGLMGEAGLGRCLAGMLGELEKAATPTAPTAAGGRDEMVAEKVVDLQALLHEMTTQLMGSMAYDMEMHAGNDGGFTAAFEHASGATAERFQNPLWRVTELLFTGRKLRRSIATVKAFGRAIVARAVRDRRGSAVAEEREEGKGDGGEKQGEKQQDTGRRRPRTLIGELLACIEDEELVADAALNYLSAGRDTVAQALTWTVYLLMRHPAVADKLREAVEQLRATTTTSASDEPADLLLTPARLPYAQAVFYESLRLYPPIPFEMKQAQADVTLPDGTFLPSSSLVVWSPWAMGRSGAIWGPDALDFRPERWLEKSQDCEGDGVPSSSSSSSWRFVPRTAGEFPVFNGGPRLCLGKRMAEVMGVRVLAEVLPRFDFRPAFGRERVSRSSLTLPMEGGLPVHVVKRDNPLSAGHLGLNR
ncbi:hypothetical protein N3K66_004799 [Trichothecium roseum]|uniref:Uncharacterized protein n=1 Tax=Trichothecium roseum TaxID=47278 RepID=A0ACC0V2U3_9HYPO|nr:hypothetical protein N3K66_004799 [Trichothecium roseum]